MKIGDILVAHGLVTQADIAAALEVQRGGGGGIGDCLVRLEKLTPDQLESVLRKAPRSPTSIEDTGLTAASLLNLMVKFIHVNAETTASEIAGVLKLPPPAVRTLIELAKERTLLDTLGAARQGGSLEIRYALSARGADWARQAMEQNEYVGPAPVPLAVYCEQISRQAIGGERVDRAMVDKAFKDLIISPELVREIGPAVNSGRSILLYGPPGNGKTSIGERVGSLFREVIYIPYCFEVEGQIIKVFDPAVHNRVESHVAELGEGLSLRREDLDARWVACWRPLLITGGELTLEMLDLSFNSLAKFYEAPLHIKALGGIFLIDDFGRQLVSPTALLNRWIVPMESRVEHLKLHTGKSFELPFDELVIFSTNLSPGGLMDPAFLRRIPYKIEVAGPTAEEYRLIFKALAKKFHLEASDEIIDEIIDELRVRNDFPLASFQPKFIIDQVRAAAKFDGAPAALTSEYVTLALRNLYTKDTPGYGPRGGGRSKEGVAAQDRRVTAL
jgi:predicted ATPase with chaperone activity